MQSRRKTKRKTQAKHLIYIDKGKIKKKKNLKIKEFFFTCQVYTDVQ